MTFAYFDCFNGISGDMVLGALVDLGADLAEIERQIKTTPLQDFKITCERVKRCGMFASKVNVISLEEKSPHRHLRHIKEYIEGGDLSERVKTRSLEAFRVLAEAEAEVHGTTIEKVHFHEVGAVDSIVDIIGAMIGLDQLGIEKAAASSIVVGSGTVECAHGIMPVPAPATALLLRGIPTTSGPIEKEMTTPTGAAILRSLTKDFGSQPEMQSSKIGYGAGSREFPRHTNFLRVNLGTTEDQGTTFRSQLIHQSLEQITCEIDDMSSEIYSNLIEQLFESGALDVNYSAITMKKNRPGVRVEILTEPSNTDTLLKILLTETTTLGARITQADRYSFDRQIKTVSTSYGEVPIKLAMLGDRVEKAAPEYEACKQLAQKNKIPVRKVLNAAQRIIEETWFK